VIVAQQIKLMEIGDRLVARGVLPIDTAEGAPPVIFWEGKAYVLRLACGSGEICYRRTRVFYAGANFEAVR
jgi:hypothetical protein